MRRQKKAGIKLEMFRIYLAAFGAHHLELLGYKMQIQGEPQRGCGLPGAKSQLLRPAGASA